MTRTPLVRYAAIALFLLAVAWLHPDFSGSSHPAGAPIEYLNNPKYTSSAPNDMLFVRELLRNNSIGPDITFASRKLRYITDAKERYQNTEVKQPLFPQSFRNISIDKEKFMPSEKILDIHLKQSLRPDQIDASKLLFGASTTPERFNDEKISPLKEWVRWLTDGHGNSNGAGMVLALFKGNDEQMDETRATLARLGINATVVHSNVDLDMAGRYMDLVRMLWEEPSRPQRDYFAIVDDDTFFPAINELSRVLSHYDPKKPYYLGTFTERNDWFALNRIPMAYGGAGVFLTAPTMEKVLAADCLAKNSDGTYKIDSVDGDRLLYFCIRDNTDIVLTPLHRLWQFDMFGDPSGFYESGHQPLSIHHFKSWHHIYPDKSHVVADACGEDCVFQKFQFADNFVISNGYSVAEYPQGIDFDVLQYEGTFEYGGVDKTQMDVVFAQTFGMLRKPLTGTGKKRQWVLLGAIKEGDGRVKQVYLKKKEDERWIQSGVEALPERDSVVVLVWIP